MYTYSRKLRDLSYTPTVGWAGDMVRLNGFWSSPYGRLNAVRHARSLSSSCSRAHCASDTVLGFSIFDPVRILRPRRSPTMHGHPSTHRRSGASIGLLLRQKVENCKDNGYLKMAPCDSPSKTGIETNLSGLVTQVWSLTHIWQLVVVTDVTDVTDLHFQKLSPPLFYATF